MTIVSRISENVFFLICPKSLYFLMFGIMTKIKRRLCNVTIQRACRFALFYTQRYGSDRRIREYGGMAAKYVR